MRPTSVTKVAPRGGESLPVGATDGKTRNAIEVAEVVGQQVVTIRKSSGRDDEIVNADWCARRHQIRRQACMDAGYVEIHWQQRHGVQNAFNEHGASISSVRGSRAIDTDEEFRHCNTGKRSRLWRRKPINILELQTTALHANEHTGVD
jgi:hypothetical protein